MAKSLTLRGNPLLYPAARRAGIDWTNPLVGNGVLRFSAIVPPGGVGASFAINTHTNFLSLYPTVATALAFNGAGSIASSMNGIIGPASSIAAATDTANTWTGLPVVTDSAITIACILQTAALPSALEFIAGPSTGTSAGFMLQLSAANAFQIGISFSTVISSGFTAAANTPYFIAVSCKSGAQSWVIVNLQTGQIFTASTTTAITMPALTGSAYVNGLPANSSSFGGKIAAVMWTAGFAGVSELLAPAQDPWAFWYPRKWDLNYKVGVVASAPPQNPYLPPFPLRAALVDLSQSLNPNLFTNPFPIQVTDRLPAIWVPKVLPDPPQPLNINLFTNPFPFNQYDWNKPYFPVIRPYPQDGININLFTNPVPFNQYDWNKPFFPHFLPYPQIGINNNLFTNPFPILSFDFGRPYTPPNNPLPPIPLNLNLFTVTAVSLPFNQYDWSTTRWFARPVPVDIQFNPNIFTNPFPYNQYDWPKPYFPKVLPYPQDGINTNLFTNPVPFNQVDWLKPFFPHFLPDPQVGINPNIFTNPYPFNQTDWSKPFFPKVLPYPQDGINTNLFTNPIPISNVDASRAFALRGATLPDQPYNQNLYTVVVTAAPFNQTDWAVPVRQRSPAPTDQQFNPNLYANPIPFNQTDFSPAHRLPQAPFDLSFALNLNIFTNPIPIFNFDYTPQHKPLPVPLDTNQGFSPLYQPVVTVTLLQRTLTGVGL